MIKNLAITPPVIGRISIGRVVERNGKRLPEKDDCFTVTTQVQNKDGWLLHPLHNQLAEAAEGKLRAIPVRVLFNATDLNLRAEFSLFDRTTGRPVCVGNGETARRFAGQDGVTEVPCPGPDACVFGREAGCKLYGRLNVQVEGQEDELGSFIFRTTGYNSVRTLAARLAYFEAVSGGNTKHLRLLLRLRAKSTTQSHRAPVYYVDLTLRNDESLTEAVCFARAEAIRQQEAGVETAALELAARESLANGPFEEGEEDIPQILEEFFPESEPLDNPSTSTSSTGATGSITPTNPTTTPKNRQSVTPIRHTALTEKLGQGEQHV